MMDTKVNLTNIEPKLVNGTENFRLAFNALHEVLKSAFSWKPVSIRIVLICLLAAEWSGCAKKDKELEALYQQLTKLYQEQNYREAIPLAQRALALNEKASGPNHPNTALCLTNLAKVYQHVGDYVQAEPLLQRAVQINEKVLGPENPQTAESLDDLGVVYREVGEYSKAEPILQRALKIREKVLGPENPETADTMDNLAQVDQYLAKYAQAEPLYQRALEVREKVLGPEHPTTVISVGNLGGLYADTGRYEKAEAFLQRALKTFEKLVGSSHPATAHSMNNLAELYVRVGEFSKARPLLQRALEIRDKMLGAEHPATALSLNNLGKLYTRMGNYADAEPLYKRCIKINEKLLGPKHPETATITSNLASLYYDLGDYSRAEPLFQRVLKIREQVFGPNHPDTALSVNNLGQLYQTTGDYRKAEPLLQHSLQISEKVFGPEHQTTASALNNLAEFYREVGRYSEAEPLIRRALTVREKVLGPEHADTAISLASLAISYVQMANYAKAEPLFKRSLMICEKVLGPEHPFTGVSIRSLAACELNTNKLSEARALALRFDKFQTKTFASILSFCSEQQRLAYQSTISPYTLFAAIDGSDYDLAANCLRYKGVVLDSIIEDRLLAEQSDRKENKNLIQRLTANKQQLGQLLLGMPTIPRDRLARQIEYLEQEIESIETNLARHVAGLGQARRALTTTVEQVQSALSTDTVLIEYLRYQHYLGKTNVEPYYAAIVLTGKGQPRWVPLGKANDIDKAVRRYRSQVTDYQTADTTLRETLRGLFDLVWLPVHRALPKQVRTLIISPDAQLNFVSFATLLTPDNHFLAEDYFIHYVSSGRDLLRGANLAPNSQLVVFGNPDFHLKAAQASKVESLVSQKVAIRGETRNDLEALGLPALPGTKLECELLTEMAKQWNWPCGEFLGADATEAELRRVRSPHILHLATHGFVLEKEQRQERSELGMSPSIEPKTLRYFENPMHRAGLALAGAQATIEAWRRGEAPPTEDDGIITAEEVASLNLEGTWLVTLSACNTGGGVAKSGEGVLGLRRGFIQAGTKNLLMTLWPISDETTVDIMTEFYEAARKTDNAPEALAKVQRDWLVKLRKTHGLGNAVNRAGAFILSSQGRP